MLREKLKNSTNRTFYKIKTKSFDEYNIKVLLIDIPQFLREETYQKYYGGKESMLLVTIVLDFLSPELKYEFGLSRNEHFPHIYGTINKTAIIRLQYYSTDRDVYFRLE